MNLAYTLLISVILLNVVGCTVHNNQVKVFTWDIAVDLDSDIEAKERE